MIISNQSGAKVNDQTDYSQASERRLWAAVLLQALEDWRSGSVRRRVEAEKFFFGSETDFETVCQGAGFEPSFVVAKLRKMKPVFQQATSSMAWSDTVEQPVTMAA